MKRNHYSALKRTILAAMILVPVVPFIFVLAIGYYYFTGSIQANAAAVMSRIVEGHRNLIDSFLAERRADLEFILRSHSFEEMSNPDRLRTVFAQLLRVSSAFVDLGVLNEEGLHLAYQGSFQLTGKVYKDAVWFQKVMKDGAYVSDVFEGYRRLPHFIIAIGRQEGERKWVLRATIDTQLFNDLVRGVRIGATGESYLLSADGVFQTERRSGGNLMELDPDSKEYIARHAGIRTFIGGSANGTKYLYATTWLVAKDWFLVVRQEQGDAFRALRSATYLIILISILGGAAIVGMALYLTGRIVQRMERLDTEKDRLGQQLIQATRLAELGEMATGFAHEINNPLQIMQSEQALMSAILTDLKGRGELKESEDLSELEDSTSQIRLQIERCSDVTRAILKFGRKGEPVSKDFDLRTFIPEVTRMVAKKADVHGIALHEEIVEDLPLVHGDPGQLQQVLVNLLNNAMDAVIERHGSFGGEIDIGASPGPSGEVQISVRDNGVGISPENLRKLFTPFFTTKPVGKGTGLGLSICYGIIRNMRGRMEVRSEEGEGTAFFIHLPAAA